MNILFLTMSNFRSFSDSGIYEDLMRVFVKKGHNVFVVAPTEKRNGESTHVAEEGEGFRLLKVRTGNLQKSGLLEKGIATLCVASQFKKAIRKAFVGTRFDFIMYSTPPITLVDVIRYFKKRDGARTYLLLKDIFPQNALDIGVLAVSGWKGFIYRYFRKKEKALYAVSDSIGCMSVANCEYVLEHNPEIAAEKVSLCPNAIEPKNMSLTKQERLDVREKYGIPADKTVFVYGGNLGRPQGVPFIIECLKTQTAFDDRFFLIAGSGTEYGLLESFTAREKPNNVMLLPSLPKAEYDRLTAACDVGMIFLDYRFTIPNYPSRLLSYMQAGLPVLACVDSNTDVGRDIENGGFGWQCASNDADGFAATVEKIVAHTNKEESGKKAKKYLAEHFSVTEAYEMIMARTEGIKNER